MTRDVGSLDPVYLNGRARDIWTDEDGEVSEFGAAGLSATIELIARVVRHVEVTPPVAAISHLSGAPAMTCEQRFTISKEPIRHCKPKTRSESAPNNRFAKPNESSR